MIRFLPAHLLVFSSSFLPFFASVVPILVPIPIPDYLPLLSTSYSRVPIRGGYSSVFFVGFCDILLLLLAARVFFRDNTFFPVVSHPRFRHSRPRHC